MEPTAPRDTPPRAVRDKQLMRADRTSKKRKKESRGRQAAAARGRGGILDRLERGSFLGAEVVVGTVTTGGSR